MQVTTFLLVLFSDILLFRYINEQFYIITGSKNVHLIIRKREDIDQYEGDRYNVAKVRLVTDPEGRASSYSTLCLHTSLLYTVVIFKECGSRTRSLLKM